MKDRCLLITDVLSIVFIICLVLISFYVNQKVDSLDYSYIEKIANSWNEGPIRYFVQSTDSGLCPSDSEYLIYDFWPGSLDGCYCKTETSAENKLTPGRCSIGQLGKKCENVQAINKIRYKGWRNKGLCVVRSKKTYLDLNVIEPGQKCSEEKKDCGVIDSLGNKLCMEDCPVNSIRVFDRSKETPPGYISQNLDGDKKLVYSNKEVQTDIIVEFKVSDNQPCADPNYTDQNKVYQLSPSGKKNTCVPYMKNEKYDFRYKLLDTYDKENLFKDNNLYHILDNLPEYNKDYFKTSTGLYYRNYVGINRNCVYYIKYLTRSSDLFLYKFRNLKDIFEYNGINNILWVMTSIISSITVFISICKIVGVFVTEFLKDDYIRHIFNTAVCSSFSALLIVAIISLVCIQDGMLVFGWLINLKCTDGLTHLALDKFYNEALFVWRLLIIYVVISAFCIIFPLSEYYFDEEFKKIEEEGYKDGQIEEKNANPKVFI